jgi:hypothetical protein
VRVGVSAELESDRHLKQSCAADPARSYNISMKIWGWLGVVNRVALHWLICAGFGILVGCLAKTPKDVAKSVLTDAQLLCVITSAITDTPALQEACKIAQDPALEEILNALVTQREVSRAAGYSFTPTPDGRHVMRTKPDAGRP